MPFDALPDHISATAVSMISGDLAKLGSFVRGAFVADFPADDSLYMSSQWEHLPLASVHNAVVSSSGQFDRVVVIARGLDAVETTLLAHAVEELTAPDGIVVELSDSEAGLSIRYPRIKFSIPPDERGYSVRVYRRSTK